MKKYDRTELGSQLFAPFKPSVLQPNVRVIEEWSNMIMAGVRFDGVVLTVMFEIEDHEHEGSSSWWLHLSVGGGRVKRLPSWKELGWCKRYFLGDDRKAIIVLPKASEYVNDNEFVLHMFSPLERDPLPDFRHRDAKGVVSL